MKSPEKMGSQEPEESEEIPEEIPLAENPYLKTRDAYRKHASEMQREVAEIGAASYETTLLRFLERTGNNRELLDAINDFMGALEHQSAYGDNSQPLHPSRIKELVEFLKEEKDELWFAGGGNRPAKKLREKRVA